MGSASTRRKGVRHAPPRPAPHGRDPERDRRTLLPSGGIVPLPLRSMRTLCLLLVLLPVSLRAQATTAPFTAHGAFVGLSVGDLDASLRWYRDTLGLRVVMERPRTNETRARMALLQGGGLTVELVQQDDAKPLRSAVPDGRGALDIHGIFKVGFVVDDFDATIAELRRRGVPIAIGPFPKRADQPANAMIRDNAGNYIQLFGR